MAQSPHEVQIGTTESDPSVFITVTANGPYIVHGTPPLHLQTITPDATGHSWTYEQGRAFAVKDGTALCRCGHSKNKPYCDGSHRHAPVDLSETASFDPLLQHSTEIDGPMVALTDNERYCAFARFCDSGEQIWKEVTIQGRSHADAAIRMAHHCPSGRLLVWDLQTKQPLEQPMPVALGLIEDPQQGCSGPLALQGGIRVVSASGRSYEVRNRQTLCRCGASSNKPFCDGSHASIKFNDGL
ncbi:MAG: CDGSH iron-sulfur domain-containing protein [Rubrivivax sp.]|nr:CDGSH iron-sulfur domain-containing protein [Rubrivivax sp.]